MGASAMAVPGWPAFAFCTMSIDSVLIVSMESCSISEFANVPPAVGFPASVTAKQWPLRRLGSRP